MCRHFCFPSNNKDDKNETFDGKITGIDETKQLYRKNRGH